MLNRWLRARSGVWILLLVVLTTGAACQADFAVDVTIEDDGSGIVRTELVLDAEATQGLLDLDEQATLPLTDLAQAGWDIGRPITDDAGETTITAEKAFGSRQQFAEVMAELSGDDGVIQDFGLTIDQSFGQVDYAVTGTIDPRVGLESFTDPALEEALGRPLVEIVTAAPYNTRPENITIEVTIAMPGELQEEGSTGTVGEAGAVPTSDWQTDLSEQEPIEVSLLTTRSSTSAQVLRGVAVVAGVLAGLVAFAQLLRIASSMRRRNPAKKQRPTDARGRPSTEPQPAPDPEPEEPAEERETGYRVVALDGMGVLYREGNDVAELLIPFARERGSTVDDDEIVTRARQLSLGRMTPADFWAAIGVEGDPNELDSAYLARHQLMPGVVKYLRALRDSNVKAACITNDAAAWAMKLRGSHSLEGLIDPWVASGSVGVRKPDAPLFEVLRRVTGEAPTATLVIDDDLRNLDAARALGFHTAWFSADGEVEHANGHEVFRSFESAEVEAREAPPEEPPPAD